MDLPGHGEASNVDDDAALPSAAAVSVSQTAGARSYDLVVGHSFGAAVAAHLRADGSIGATRWVLEELPGPRSVAWEAEADAIVAAATRARDDGAAAIAETTAQQPRWSDRDRAYAVHDLGACAADQVAAGVRVGARWWDEVGPAEDGLAVLLLLAPDAPGVNHLEDATALRGEDRHAAVQRFRAAVTVLPTGHCVHRDDPAGWVEAITAWCR
jgi:pimeloyl-ACP methyl ester carboxylesterase